MSVKSVPTINESLDEIQKILSRDLITAEAFKSSHEACSDPASQIPFQDRSSNIQLFAYNMTSMISSHELENLEKEVQDLKTRVTVLEMLEKEQFNSRIENIACQINKCKSHVEIFKKEFIKTMQTSPSFLVSDKHDHGYLFGVIGDFSLKECHCKTELNRANRKRFSTRLVNFIEKKWPEKKEIIVSSIGPGGCLPELEYHALLEEKGIKAHWILIDPNLSPKTVEEFSMMANWATPGISVTPIYNWAKDYFICFTNQNPNPILPDVFLFVDVGISELDIANFQTQINHSCLFAEYKNKIKFTEVNNKS